MPSASATAASQPMQNAQEQVTAQKPPKKQYTLGPVGRAASGIMKTGASIDGFAGGVVSGATGALAFGGTAYGIGALFDATRKVATGKIPIKSYVDDATGVLIKGLDDRFKDTMTGAKKSVQGAFSAFGEEKSLFSHLGYMVKGVFTAPYKFAKNMLSTIKDPAAREAFKNAKLSAKEGKGFIEGMKAAKAAGKEFLSNPNNTKIVSKPVRVIALGVGALALVISVVKAKFGINEARHNIDAKFAKTPTLNSLHNPDQKSLLSA